MVSELSELDKLCFKCPVPGGCNEDDPRCLRRQALLKGYGRIRRVRGGSLTLTGQIAMVLLKQGSSSSSQLAATLNSTREKISKALHGMQQRGTVVKKGDIWILPERSCEAA